MGFQPTRFDPPDRLGLHSPANPQALPASAKIELEIVRGAARHTRRPVVGKVFLIGSACDCDLVLGDEQFPDAYAYLFVQNGEVTLRHLGAGPAVLVDGQPVQARRLNDGDVLCCGPYAFRLIIASTGPGGGKERPSAGPHFAIAADKAEKASSFAPAEEVLGLRVAREEVAQLLADIAAAMPSQTEELKLYRGPEPKSPPTLIERVRRRASA